MRDRYCARAPMHEVYRLLETMDAEDPLEPLVDAGVVMQLQPEAVDRPAAYERVIARILGVADGALDGIQFGLTPGDPQFERSPWAIEIEDGPRTYRAHVQAAWHRFDPELLLLLNSVLEGRGRSERAAIVNSDDADQLSGWLAIVVAGPEAQTHLAKAGFLLTHVDTHPRLREVAPGHFEDRMHDRPLTAEDFVTAIGALLPQIGEDVAPQVEAWIDEVTQALCSDSATIKCPWLGRFTVHARTNVEETDPVARAPSSDAGPLEVRFTPGRVLRERLDPDRGGEEESTVSGGPRRVPEAVAELLARRRHDAIYVPRLGKFVLSTLKERIGRDPATGRTIAIASRSMVHFAPSTDLLAAVDPTRA